MKDISKTDLDTQILVHLEDEFQDKKNTLIGVGRNTWQKINLGKVAIFGLSIFLFILAISLMKEGANSLTHLVKDTLSVTNPTNSLGFGWISSYIIMSGSPVAAVALTFFDNGIIDQLSTLTMINGSRMGASFIVLFVGFVYILRGRDREISLGMGLLSLIVTASTYLFSLPLGIALLTTGTFDQIQIHGGRMFVSVIDFIFNPITNIFVEILPAWGLFLIGIGIIMVSFRLFDKCLPQMALKESNVGHLSSLIYRPWVMFILGAGITLVSMSVSVSLGILIPLSDRGFVRRENVIPYIMGANITTFIDTLFISVLLNNHAAFTVVLVEMISITLISALILATIYRRYERVILSFVLWVTARKRNLLLFMLIIITLPLILLFL